MHEMSLATGMLQLIEEEAIRQSFKQVKTVVLEIGRLAAVEVEALVFCFDAVTRGSLAEGAKLDILINDGQAWCLGCKTAVVIAADSGDRDGELCCPRCGGYRLQITGGTDMRIKELEVI